MKHLFIALIRHNSSWELNFQVKSTASNTPLTPDPVPTSSAAASDIQPASKSVQSAEQVRLLCLWKAQGSSFDNWSKHKNAFLSATFHWPAATSLWQCGRENELRWGVNYIWTIWLSLKNSSYICNAFMHEFSGFASSPEWLPGTNIQCPKSSRGN